MAKPIMDINQIKKILPHRYPFLLVDKVIEMGADSITAVKNVTGNEAIFNGHFPEQPIFPGVLQIEALAQVGGICALSQANAPKGITFFAGVDGVKWKRPIVPGDQMIMTVKVIKMRGPLVVCQGAISVDGEVACEIAELKMMILPAKE
jgi:3-hydroxyacyl-[acyl-carrier-protein] dehydratase